jgi:hypothetical protein
MSEGSGDEGEFDFRLWCVNTSLSEPGIKKLVSQEVVDKKALLLLTDADITACKLGVGDRAKLAEAVDRLRPRGKPQPVKTHADEQGGAVGGKDDAASVKTNVDGSPIQTPVDVNGAPDVNGALLPGQVGVKTQFSIDEVAAFLAGQAIPAELQASMNVIRGTQALVPGTSTDPTTFQRPNLNLHGPQFQTAISGLQTPQRAPNLATYCRPAPFLQPRYPAATGFQPSTVPIYSPSATPYMPGRFNTQTSGNQDHQLQQWSEGYQRTALRDLLTINECGQYIANPGEAPLYLPINFVSHLRGNRVDDEEILQTSSGSKLYLSQGSKKISPDKLTQGLFFGANARIVSRMIPNLTPELAGYLDYLRKIGDLLVNYTSASVYLLDHEHRFEVVELGKNWNCIDPTLSLNILKKKELSNVASGTSKTSNSSSSAVKSDFKSDKRSMVICWQYNQPDGCQFHPNCRFRHICNIVACGQDHPAYKHVFRPSTKDQSKQL